MNAPCKDCRERTGVCHDSCERYQAFHQERVEISRKRQMDIIRYRDDKKWHPRAIRGEQ